MKKETKSPITDNLLRQPGQSLDEEINSLIDDDLSTYVMIPMLFIFLAVWEWLRWYLHSQPSPWTMTIMSLITVIFSAYKLRHIRKKLKNLRQGRDGEMAVSELLNFFREAKMRVFHDIVGKNFNLDHVVVSTRGVYLIETKTYSKPMKGKAEIIFDGKSLIKNDYDLGDGILIQVKAGRKWLTDLIEDLTAKKYSVQPVVAFPGWYVKMTNDYKSDIWVVNPKNLSGFINKRPEVLSEEDVKLISNHLARYIRSTQK